MTWAVVLCFAYFVGLVPIYWLTVRRRGVVREPRIEARRPSVLLPKWLIYYLLWVISPFERALLAARVSPNALTTSGLILSIVAGVVLARGSFGVGGWLYLFVGIIDLFDGRIARATERVSAAGAYWDSIADRYSECAVFAGLFAYYRAGEPAIAALVLVGLAGSLMVSYSRARAEAAGVGEASSNGAWQRPERIFLVGVALAASPFFAARFERASPPRYLVAVAAIALLAAVSHTTALRRSLAAFRALRARDDAERERAVRIAGGG